MERLKCLFVVGALAVVVSVVAAGPAAAAKGGNSDTARACQQGGHENRFEAETGNPFKNAGDCTSHGALGGALVSLQLTTDQYSCGSGCTYWGYVNITGLSPHESWFIVNNGGQGYLVVQGDADGNGNVNGFQANLPCATGVGPGGGPYQLSSTAPGDGKIFVNVNSPCG
jgi:hypothetical protein